MAKYAKWIGAGLGWAFGGPIGGVLGFAFGAMWDDNTLAQEPAQKSGRTGYRQEYGKYRHNTRSGDFASALMVLSAAVMKADGKYMKSELNFIKDYFTKSFGPAIAAEQVGVLKQLLKKDIPVREVCQQVQYFMEHAMRLQLLHYLFNIAKADGHVASSEESLIGQMAHWMGISEKDYASIRAMFYKDANQAYTILEITSDASDQEIKKAYRKMANKYHPDKVNGLGESYTKAAKEKFLEVQEAYETLRKERGIK